MAKNPLDVYCQNKGDLDGGFSSVETLNALRRCNEVEPRLTASIIDGAPICIFQQTR